MAGSMMQSAALLWHVTLLVPPERRAMALGLVGLARVAPIAIFSLISGVVADAWDRRGGQGAYVALPTMATSNQMFDRVARFLEKKDGKNNILLLHGKAALNEHLADLCRAAEVYDDEVDNAVAALTSMLEPIMIVFLAVIVGTIVLALFTPLISIITGLQQQT